MMSQQIEVPEWIDSAYFTAEALNDPTHPDHECQACKVSDIEKNGNGGGTYMPALEYFTALQTMNKYGDQIIEYLHAYGISGVEKLNLKDDTWSSFCCRLVNGAFTEWAVMAAYMLRERES